MVQTGDRCTDADDCTCDMCTPAPDNDIADPMTFERLNEVIQTLAVNN